MELGLWYLQLFILLVILLAVAAVSALVFLWARRRRSPQVDRKAEIALGKLIPESCFVDVDGVNVHYVQAGRGKDLVLLHGIGASVFIWRFLFPLLEVHFRVTAIDLPGFGKSSKDAKRSYTLDAQSELVTKILSLIGIREATLVGSSMGGTIGLWVARLDPKRFRRVVALAPATDRSLVPALAQYFATIAPVIRRALNRRTMRLILGRVLARKELITDDVIDAYLDPFLDRGESVHTFGASLGLLADPRLPDGLGTVESDVLVVYGERDLMVPRRSVDRLIGILPHARLLVHADGGHHIMEDEPVWTATVICDFLS